MADSPIDLTGEARAADRGDAVGTIIGDFYRDPDDGYITAGPGGASIVRENDLLHLEPGEKYLGRGTGELHRPPRGSRIEQNG